MKTKIGLLLGGIALLTLVHFINKNSKTNSNINYQKASFNFTKCTPTKFLFENIDTTKQISPLFKNLGNLHFPITTENERVQAFFDQGVKLSYAFNHAEGHRSFLETARLAPNTAMAYWGQAFALGPNINDPLPDDERKNKINEAMAKARRYSEDLTKDVAELNMAYMLAMEKVVKKHPEDANIQILYAASVMNTVPWNYWDKDGNPSPNIKEAKAALEKSIALEPENPGGHHYYIHMVELPFPDLGVASADQLASIMPGAGHIVHMPSHIYIRVGRYLDAVKSNQAPMFFSRTISFSVLPS